jgi:hypothetical protein
MLVPASFGAWVIAVACPKKPIHQWSRTPSHFANRPCTADFVHRSGTFRFPQKPPALSLSQGAFNRH